MDLPYTFNPSELLDHFINITTPCIGSPEFQRILHEEGFRLSVEAPYLLHTILAFSASHLSYLWPQEQNYGMVATFHYDLSLTLYRTQILSGLDAKNADALLGCCHLQSMLAFRGVGSADFNEDRSTLPFTWLRTMQGVGILWQANNLGLYLNESYLWRPVLVESGFMETFACDHSGAQSVTSALSVALHQLCEVELKTPSNPAPKENVYRKPLSRLCVLLHGDITQDKICLFMRFISVLQPNFLQLLDHYDPRATLIIASWCAWLSQINQWWIVDSAKTECRRLCAYLSMNPDRRIRDILGLLASKSGYLIQDRRDGKNY